MLKLSKNAYSIALGVAAMLALTTIAPAQQTLIPEDQEWQFLHPMGTLPPKPDTTPDSDFNTTWYLKKADFLVNYDGPRFDALTTGNPAVLDSADSGPAFGPFAYGTVDTITTFNTPLTTPATGNRYTSYYRTTFTVPTGGVIEPSFHVSFDDGGYVYLDGVLIATVNINDGVADTYTSFASDATNTEVVPDGLFNFHLRSAGVQPGASPGDVKVLVPVPSLAAGEHTLALSVHNSGADSSDMGMFLELKALDPSTCTLHAVVSEIVRDFKGTPANTADDEFSFKVTLTGSNTGTTWSSDNPAVSGSYGVATTMGPYNAAAGDVTVNFTAAANPLCQTSVTVTPPSAFKTLVDYNHTWKLMNPLAGVLPPRPAGGADTNFETTWFLKEGNFLTQYDGPNFGANGVAGSYEAITGPGPFAVGGVDGIAAAQPVGAAGTTPTLPASGSRRTSYYRTTFTTTQPISLVTFDVLCDDGVFIYLDGNLVAQVNMPVPPAPAFNVMAAAVGDENLITPIDLSQPPGGNVIATVNGLTPGEHTLAVEVHQVNLTSSDFGLALKMSGIEVAGQCLVESTVSNVIRSEAGTPGVPGDDSYSFNVTVNGANAGATWNSNSTPASGNYGVVTTFGPFPVSAGSTTVLFSASADPACTASVTVTPPGCTMSAVVSNVARNVGASPADPRDDTMTFNVTVSGTFLSTGWTSDQVPASGAYNTGTQMGPFPATAAVTVTLTDSADPACTTAVTVQPPRYVPAGEIVPYSHVWKVMNPLAAAVPDGPGGPDADFDTTWFLAESNFVAQYNGPTFGSGGVAGSYEAVTGPGPLAVGGIDGLAAGTTIGPVGTTLTLPASGSRYSSYYRTTFTTTEQLNNLKFDILCDDGAFIYLDGVLVAQENMPGVDSYLDLASGARDETLITTIDLSAAPGGNVVVSVPNLAAGTHTLAVSVHQTATTSSDFGLALTFYGGGSSGQVDSDGDGQFDSSEAVAGTNPNDASDFLHITGLVRNGAGADLTFPSKAAHNYQAEVSNTLTGGWTPFGGVIAGTGSPITTSIPQVPLPGETKYFLRVRVVP